ncbi:MAG: polyphosphate kinase 1 [Bacteroidota bacterium]
MAKKDQLLHFPFQSYDPVIRFFEEAAADEQVEEIWASLYRVASKSAITQALIAARKAGKKVTVFVEVKARFDEASNLYWASQMEEAGVKVLYSMPGLKVHAKIAMVVRREGENRVRYCYLGTGNFNEKTARVYVDEAILTADKRLTAEINKVFQFLNGKRKNPKFEHLLVAPFNMRKQFNALIEQEIAEAKAGRKAEMTLKMNSLEDEKIIARLYKASQAGVNIRIVVRGICRLVPGIPGQSENIQVTSIVDRFLEHARVYLFHNAGKPVMYLASADWMKRNLSRRIEVAFPIYNRTLFREMKRMLDIQLRDNTKARVIDAQHSNAYVKSRRKKTRAQYASYELLGGQV